MLVKRSPKLMITRRVFLFSTLVNRAMLLLKALRMKFMIHLDDEHLVEWGQRTRRRKDGDVT